MTQQLVVRAIVAASLALLISVGSVVSITMACDSACNGGGESQCATILPNPCGPLSGCISPYNDNDCNVHYRSVKFTPTPGDWYGCVSTTDGTKSCSYSSVVCTTGVVYSDLYCTIGPGATVSISACKANVTNLCGN